MKLPNGYGSVYKLSGKRRNPWVAMKTTGWDIIDGHKRQRKAPVGYFPTSEAALQALAEYNGDPFDLSLTNTTFAQVFELWKKDEFDDKSNPNTVRGYNAAYKHCAMLYGLKMSAITVSQLQKVLDDHSDMSYERVNKIRNLFSKMYQWCIKNEFMKRNKAEALTISVTPNKGAKEAFTSAEIKELWKHADHRDIRIVLILIYCGVRINELLALNKTDVDLNEQVFTVRKSKTEAGTNRKVPIADKVLPFWKQFIDDSPNACVFTNERGTRLAYDDFRKCHWSPLMEQLGMTHSIHETRHTCISQLTMKGANPTIIKIIVGHKSVMSLTEKTYTHIESSELVKTINLIP